jgi:hypothetical protein
MNQMQVNVDIQKAASTAQGFLEQLSPQEIEYASQRYRKFLQLPKIFPTEVFAPTKDIDEIWHLHMLSPKAYQADCQNNFGGTLDHIGGFGKGSDKAEFKQWLVHLENTKQRWFEVYNEAYLPSDATPTLQSMFDSGDYHGNGHGNGITAPLE